jgi:hypothetical protein
VSKDDPKSKPDAGIGGKRDTVANNLSGRVTHDDRGNAVWQWASATGSFNSEATSGRLKKLDNASLSIAEDAPSTLASARTNPLGTVKGYSPYDSGVLEKKSAPRKKTDLRKLSEWLKLKKQAENNKPDDE